MMKFNKDDKIILSIILVFLTLLFLSTYTWKYEPKEIPTETIIKTDTIYLKDTIVIETPIEVERIKVKDTYIQDTVYIENSPTIADIPIEHAIYQDTNYLAVVSGFQPKLDSLVIYNNNKIINKETTITKYKKIDYGLQVGVGVTPKGIQPYVGFGLNIKF